MNATGFLRLIPTHGRVREIVFQVLVKEVGDPLVQCRLVCLHGQAIVTSTVDDFLRDLRLASHRVDRDHSTRKFEDFQQFRDGGDLIAFWRPRPLVPD